MRIAIIGCGWIAGTHAQALREMGHGIAVVIDRDAKTAEAFGERWRADRSGTDPVAALADDIDAIHICTPPTLHYPMVKDALNAGKHVICEKPLCLQTDDAKELMLLAKEKKRVGAVNFNLRFYDACQRAKSIIAHPDFGKVFFVHGAYLQEFHALPCEDGWRYQPELAGPMRATTEIGSHGIDLIRFWTGLEISEVSANFGRFTPERFVSDGVMDTHGKTGSKKVTVASEDVAVISMRFHNGAMGSLVLSEVSHGRTNRITLEVTGAAQSVWWNSEKPYHLNSGRRSEGVRSQVNAFSGGFPNTFKAFFEEVYRDIETGKPSEKPSYPTFYDGYVNAAVCEAIHQSASHNSAWVPVTTLER